MHIPHVGEKTSDPNLMCSVLLHLREITHNLGKYCKMGIVKTVRNPPPFTRQQQQYWYVTALTLWNLTRTMMDE